VWICRSVFDLSVPSNWLDNSGPMWVMPPRLSLQSVMSVSNLLELLSGLLGVVNTFE
jgi:hypothetical protein